MDDNMQVSLVNDALQMALSNRKPPSQLIWHTDRGSQYASDSHRELLSEHDIKVVVSDAGKKEKYGIFRLRQVPYPGIVWFDHKLAHL